MRISAKKDLLNSIKNAIEKEGKASAVNVELIKKMKFLLHNRIPDKAAETFDIYAQSTEDITIIETIIKKVLAFEYKNNIPKSVIDKLTKHAKMLPNDIFNNDPYLNNIKFDNNKYNNLVMETDKCYKYQIFECDAPEFTNYVYYPSWGFLRCEVTNYLLKNTKTDEFHKIFPPSEILQTQKHIDNANGNVLTLGLKLGYFPYLAGLKDDVSKITIIEEDNDIIGFFNEHIFTQFDEKTKSKITIINQNPIEYMKNLVDGEFDYCFANLWDTPEQLLDYCNLKRLHNKFTKMKIDYYKEFQLISEMYELVSLNAYFAYQQRIGNMPKEIAFSQAYSDQIDETLLKFVEDVFEDYRVSKSKDLTVIYDYNFILDKFNSIVI